MNSLSYSHFELLVEIEDPLKRTFYEMECIRGNWLFVTKYQLELPKKEDIQRFIESQMKADDGTGMALPTAGG